MSDPKVYEVLAEAFAAEGVTHHFSLLGNANMYWADALVKKHNVKSFHARHEHCALAMAEGYHRSTGEVGVASVTCGPGFTQIMTALTVAARGSVPMVVFAGEAPITPPFHVHRIDQGPLATATGAHYIPVRTKERMLNDVREAFYVARTESRPVVLSVPEDFQNQPYPFMAHIMPSTDMLPTPQRVMPDPDLIAQAVEMIAAAERPIIIGGRGAVRAGAGPALEALAEQSGALLATSLLAKGLFDGNPFSLGIAGAFANPTARECFAESDLVLGFGAILGFYTSEGGYLYPNARVVQLDINPRGVSQGLPVGDLKIRSDAKVGAETLLQELKTRNVKKSGLRTREIQDRIANDVYDSKAYDIPPGVVDPRALLVELDKTIPPDWDIVFGGAHYFNFVAPILRNRKPERYHITNQFGEIGGAMATAIGIAAARGDGKVLLIEGDGSLLMNVQEMETVRRHGIKLLMCVMNDGGYGAEFHKFRGGKKDDTEMHHGRGDLAAITQGFGLRGTKVTQLGGLARLFEAHQGANQAELWDVHVADIPSVTFRRLYYGEH